VATYATCDGIFNNHCIANFLENSPVKNFKNWLRFNRVAAMSLVSPFLLGHGVCFVNKTVCITKVKFWI